MKTIIPYGKQDISEADIENVIAALKSDFITQGPKVEQFEAAFAKYTGAKYAVAVSNGTAALHLCCLALNVNSSSNIITTPITFAASANCVRYCGGKISFADIDQETALIDITSIREILASSPKGTYQGIIPVDFAGYPVNLEELRKLANEYNLWIIEDACHSPGAFFVDSKGEKQYCGNGIYADVSVFSFHPVKHITTAEGGMISTNNEDLYKKLIMLRSHGITKSAELMAENHGGWYYEMQSLGYNYRLPDINAALGTSQLQRATQSVKRRQEIAQTYDTAFKNTAITRIIPDASVSHAYHLYVIRTKKRKELYDKLREKGIYAQVHYIPLHTLPYYQELGYKKGSLPNAEAYYEECLSLPMYPTLSNEELQYVIKNVIEITNE